MMSQQKRGIPSQQQSDPTANTQKWPKIKIQFNNKGQICYIFSRLALQLKPLRGVSITMFSC